MNSGLIELHFLIHKDNCFAPLWIPSYQADFQSKVKNDRATRERRECENRETDREIEREGGQMEG